MEVRVTKLLLYPYPEGRTWEGSFLIVIETGPSCCLSLPTTPVYAQVYEPAYSCLPIVMEIAMELRYPADILDDTNKLPCAIRHIWFCGYCPIPTNKRKIYSIIALSLRYLNQDCKLSWEFIQLLLWHMSLVVTGICFKNNKRLSVGVTAILD